VDSDPDLSWTVKIHHRAPQKETFAQAGVIAESDRIGTAVWREFGIVAKVQQRECD
jgi:hypothetical protein